jgi:hypothetical protein
MNQWELRSVRLRELGYSSYQDYLLSPHWRAIKDWWWSRRKSTRRCWCCGRKDVPTDLHHRTYENLGAEKEGDLIRLCRVCHELTHEVIRKELSQSTFWGACKFVKKKLAHRLWKKVKRGMTVEAALNRAIWKTRGFIERGAKQRPNPLFHQSANRDHVKQLF